MNSFIFVRHGQSEANANGTIATSDTKLTEAGVQQARQTAAEIKDLGITKIVCSPMLRAQQTAETIAGELGIDLKNIEVIDELRERNFANLEGKPKNHDTPWYYLSDEEPDGEKTTDMLNRMYRCLDKIKKRNKGNKILVVGHGTSGFYLLQAAKGKTNVEDFDPIEQMNNADFIVVKID